MAVGERLAPFSRQKDSKVNFAAWLPRGTDRLYKTKSLKKIQINHNLFTEIRLEPNCNKFKKTS